MERRLNGVPDPAPTPPRDHGKENHLPPPEPRKLPRKMRPRRRKREHHHQWLPGAIGSAPGTSPPPRGRMSTPVKYPQPPQLPQPHQPPRPTANENSSRAHLPDQPDPSWLYKRAHSSISKKSTTRSRRDNFSWSNVSFSSKRSHRDYFSGSPYWAINKNESLTDSSREAISLSQSGYRQETDPILTPLCAALPDVAIEVGPELPEAASASRIPREDWPPVILEIPCSSSEPDKLSAPLQCPDTPGKWFQPPSRGSKRRRSSTPLSPRRPRKRYSSHGRWCEQWPYHWYKPNDTIPHTLTCLFVAPNKGYFGYTPNPCNPHSVTPNKGTSRSHSPKPKEGTAFLLLQLSK